MFWSSPLLLDRELWLQQQLTSSWSASGLERLLQRLQQGQPPGLWDLPQGWQLQWDRTTLKLVPLDPPIDEPNAG